MYFENSTSTRFFDSIVDFTYPRLHKGKDWYVDFTVFNPATNKMQRKKYMLNRYKSAHEREDMAAEMIHNIMKRLKAGWNPFVTTYNPRYYTDFKTVLERYENCINIEASKGTLKVKTQRDYLSRLNQLKIYMHENGREIQVVNEFNTAFAIDFLDYLLFDKDVSAKTRNNYRTWLSTFGTWLVSRKYLEFNPIEQIHMIKEQEKFRDALTPAALSKLKAYISRENPPFYLACMMEYYTFIRPDELRHITIGDIDITNQTVYIDAKVSKNRKGQYVALNDAVLKIMIKQNIFSYPSHCYVFGHDIIPGERQININQFRLEWGKVRKTLNFPASYQFYSLKDSGIRDLANAEGIVVARDQARHSDIAVTNKYLKRDNVVNEQTKHFAGNL
ncbi:tyrosine-type recombinase/integrase [Segatella salivae]|uniref:Site-specific recombinase, phage integrase family n=1 Tax=Segatella salivae DSM 15606 TaxID=888832 RepID=E6MN60_9BACT|nr:tyrosine-type recombinase/integrase [Segatella salivae]EFV04937.1 site-specific recombinase, phage integrase family [Segatella salivae DSM 15606]